MRSWRSMLSAEGKLKSRRTFAVIDPGVSDGFRVDVDGNIWTSAADGVHCITPDGELIGKILVPETVTAIKRGDLRLIREFAEVLEDDEGALLESNAQQFGGLFNTIECRETWAGVDQAARDNAIQAGGMGDPRALSGGIAEALIATAAGLCVAIPALISYRYLRGRVEGIVVEMEKHAIRMADALESLRLR